MTSPALTADTTLIAEQRAGRPRIRWSQAWPVVMRLTAPTQVHLVHGAGGPLGGDAFALSALVGPGAALRIRSAGATIVQPGTGDWARWDVDAEVGEAGHLDWGPEATVVCDGGALESRLRVRLASGAGAVLRELVVLGRHGERGGRYRGELRVEVDGSPLLSHCTLLDGADPVLCGPAGTAGARAVGTLVVAGADAQRVSDPGDLGAGEDRGLRWSWTDLDGPGRVLLAVGEPRLVTELLDAQRAALDPEPLRRGVPHPEPLRRVNR